MTIQEKIERAVALIKALEILPAYDAAFVFGSAARGDVTEHSDLDVQVISSDDNPSIDILHPTLHGIKLDLTFLSFGQLLARTKKEDGALPQRVPMIAEAKIIFDKSGKLSALHREYKEKSPPKFLENHYPQQRFLLYHANNKVERNLKDDQTTAMLAMHIGINDVLKIHYGIHGHWWVSNKRILADLDTWDRGLAKLVEEFLFLNDVQTRFAIWSQILSHVSKPLGGHTDITSSEGVSEVSVSGLGNLLSMMEEKIVG